NSLIWAEDATSNCAAVSGSHFSEYRTIHVWNNIFIGWPSGSNSCHGVWVRGDEGTNWYLYNNTAVIKGSGAAYARDTGNVYYKNNIGYAPGAGSAFESWAG